MFVLKYVGIVHGGLEVGGSGLVGTIIEVAPFYLAHPAQQGRLWGETGRWLRCTVSALFAH